MELDLNEIYNRVEPWELKIKLDGETFAIRRLSNEDMAKLQSLEKRSEEEGKAFFASLFEPPLAEPDIEKLMGDSGKVAMIVGAIVGYVSSFVKKKATDAARAAGAAAGATEAAQQRRGSNSIGRTS
jgi:hypothetical protein